MWSIGLRQPAFLLAAMAATACASQSLAQSIARPAGVRATQQDWVFVPVIIQSAGSLTVPGVLALRDKSALVGENLVAVWYANPGAPGVDWPAKSWTSQDQWEAIKWTKQQFAIGDQYDFLWPTADPQSAGSLTEVPQDYFKGLLDNDPFAALLTTPDGEAMVSLLTAIGYKSATINVDKDGPCSTKIILSALADTTAFAVSVRPPKDQVGAMYESLVPLACVQVVQPAPPPPPPPPAVVPGTTTPLPGAPVNPVNPWKPGPRPDRHVPGCSTATTCCYGRQIFWFYTVVGWFGLTYVQYCESEVTWTCPAPPTVPPAPCPPIPTCPAPLGPYMPPQPPGPVPCGFDYY
ncbi:MAG: hypothetical protein ACK5ZV_16065 [bacterium]|jgi:hypothetical protein